ncbi:1-deoxy-D-xylulose-5-phosphate reductoisomerase [Umboniibacter marinipuniceus]|uniref:1-deoxy-D-xylulose 5-phosphate reductoisomerase n=1 Tax=Umboniibacter marinipuniceus TaxID=569599 RepID=A0A3M0A792_9GAMM|nr:1-deoxy-D-xylulose-5-phosphate reductoisomerase [Umboniibacter marinipuniceus]RMA78678.1 1-deoxy-D-xylulose 5-phosphate reductoisomerase [Umboniibacter marinipuniceus]
MPLQQVTVLGSTGSIGQNTLDVIAQHPNRYQVFALVAGANWQQMLLDAQRFSPEVIVMADATAADHLRRELSGSNIDVQSGLQAMIDVSETSSVDIVMAAIVGAAGLPASLAAAKAGKKVLLANKESLVVAGDLFMRTVRESGATLLPIDSEHNAIFQCLEGGKFDREQGGVSRILLTGSGGPFRTTDLSEFGAITPERAIAHPNWSMGPKISVDSATMMNKGLELIEACWLFGVTPADIDVVLHPQSIIHSMVSYLDGSVIAQMGNPDMRTPIAYGLAYPERIASGVKTLDFTQVARLDFDVPDRQRYPCLWLAREAFAAGGASPAVLNAANEVAVAAFLAGEIAFCDIALVCERTLEAKFSDAIDSLDEILTIDRAAREVAHSLINQGL